MWGRLADLRAAGLNPRNTPTHVGKTRTFRNDCNSAEKHPHACGEDYFTLMGSARHAETPPRMWGRQIGTYDQSTGMRNTPTHVGKTYHTKRNHP